MPGYKQFVSDKWKVFIVEGGEDDLLSPVDIEEIRGITNEIHSLSRRPCVGNLAFKTLSLVDGRGLVKPFRFDEVKAAVWDCDNFKSLGPDGINFGFIKEFWQVLKEDRCTLLWSYTGMAN
ncbi:hypothetical protein MTR_8g445150 [Medicago truncatula]|uniref:Uncharacterized protein n=1 Tax=Medicago truncatula TaxID=3880 RepID=A0A072TNZ3_MEDTR|nr:hypothetical protein MTR_8g445150 [Medicago truncatula]